MTQENKELLLKDLSARLPYKVMAKYYDLEDECETWDEIEGIDSSGRVEIGQYILSIENIKPYLLPLSSMTDEQFNEKWELEHSGNMEHLSIPALDWLNKNHFDYRGLIEKGLAIDATDKNIY